MTKTTDPSFDQISQKLDTLQRSYDDKLSQQQTRIAAQDQRIAAQDQRIAAQDREIASLRHDRGTKSIVRPTHRAEVDSPETVRSEAPDRRRFLKGAAVAAAGAGLMLVGRPDSAAAADGGAVLIGNANTATNTTSLTTSVGSGLTATGAATREGLNGFCSGSVSSWGVNGVSDIGYGVRGGTTTGYSLYADGTNPRIGIGGSSYPSAPTAGSFDAGDIIKDQSSNLWLCTVAGTPGTWRRIGGPGSAGQLSLLSTVQRRVNTLDGTGIVAGTMGINTSRVTGNLAAALGFATNEITGVMAAVTAYPPGAAGTFGGSGYLGVAGNYTGSPSITFSAGQSVMTGLVMSSLVAGTLTIAAFATPVDVTIDIVGYFR